MIKNILPLSKKHETDVWRNVKKLGSELTRELEFKIKLPAGSTYETDFIETTGWATVEFYIYSDALLEMSLMLSNDLIKVDETSSIYIPPKNPVHFRWPIIAKYFTVRLTNISSEYAKDVRVRIVMSPYRGSEWLIPKRATLFTFRSKIGEGNIIYSPVFDMDLMELAIFTLYSSNAYVTLWVSGSPDYEYWYPIIRWACDPGRVIFRRLNPPLRFLRFSLKAFEETWISFSFSTISKI